VIVLIARPPLESLDDHLIHLIVGDPTRRPGPRLVHQPLQPASQKPTRPRTHHVSRYPKALREVRVREAVGAQQHDLRPQRQRLRRLASPRPPGQARTSLIGQMMQAMIRRRISSTVSVIRPVSAWSWSAASAAQIVRSPQ